MDKKLITIKLLREIDQELHRLRGFILIKRGSRRGGFEDDLLKRLDSMLEEIHALQYAGD